MSNSRYTEHKPSVQGVPPSYHSPRKKLTHTTKYKRSVTSGVLRGVVHPIPKRVGLFRRIFR